MKIAYILFDGITLLDFIGIYDPISRLQSQKHLPELSWDLCGMQASIKDSFGLTIQVDQVQPDLSSYDMLIVPGGFGTRRLQKHPDFLSWMATAKDVAYKVSICTGSLLLGAAGFLQDKHATTHFNEYENLEGFAKKVHKNRIVKDGKTITAGAVASSLDLGLFICELLTDAETKEFVRKTMDYPLVESDILIAES